MKKVIHLIVGLSLSCFLDLALGNENAGNRIFQEEDLTRKEERIKKLEDSIRDLEEKIEQLEKKIVELSDKLKFIEEKLGIKSDHMMTIFTSQDNGKKFKIHVGEIFQVILAENPTTGYVWTVYKSGKPQISLLSKSYSVPQEEPPIVGRGGTRIIIFKAVKVGSAELILRLKRPWKEETKFSESFLIMLEIIDK